VLSPKGCQIYSLVPSPLVPLSQDEFCCLLCFILLQCIYPVRHALHCELHPPKRLLLRWKSDSGRNLLHPQHQDVPGGPTLSMIPLGLSRRLHLRCENEMLSISQKSAMSSFSHGFLCSMERSWNLTILPPHLWQISIPANCTTRKNTMERSLLVAFP
jgi:hypothetical protein